MRQQHRERLINVTRPQLVDAAQKYLAKPLEKGLSSKVIFGSESIDKNQLREAGWKVQSPIEILATSK